MRNAIAAVGGPPIFERPLQIVRPVFPDANKFLAPFQAALASGQVTNGGYWVLEFERQLSEYLGVPTLVFCNGQMALMTMLRPAGIGRGEIIVPSFTFAATPHAVRWCGGAGVCGCRRGWVFAPRPRRRRAQDYTKDSGHSRLRCLRDCMRLHQ